MIGIDIVSLERITLSYERFGSKFLNRFLSSYEQSLCLKADTSINLQRVAGFWASKEAISKALGTGIGEELGFLDILLDKTPKGQPTATLTASKLQYFNISNISLSITHDAKLIIAAVIIDQYKTT